MKYNEFFGAGMLTGIEIERRIKCGDIKINPFDPKKLNPNSYNLTLDKELKIYNLINVFHNPYSFIEHDIDCESDSYYLDSHNENKYSTIEIPDEGMILLPGVLYIGRTVERTSTDKFIPMINGRSSGGRLGLSVHICAGFGDIGFDGTWTLEITVVHPLRIYAGDEVAQVCFFTPYGDNSYKYRGRYQGQIEATTSRFNQDKSEESMIDTIIPEVNAKNMYKSLVDKYGPQEFFNIGIKSYNDLVYSLELDKDEGIDLFDGEIPYIVKYDYETMNVSPDEASVSIAATSKVVGRRYELEGVGYIYVYYTK